jgi:hypothetical protein
MKSVDFFTASASMANSFSYLRSLNSTIKETGVNAFIWHLLYIRIFDIHSYWPERNIGSLS